MVDSTNPEQQYMVLIVEPEWRPSGMTMEQMMAIGEAHRAFQEAVAAAGVELVDGDALQPPETAVKIKAATDTSPAIFTDGAFAETKEVITGYYKIKGASPEQARELAALCPVSPGGHLQLWPVFDTSNM